MKHRKIIDPFIALIILASILFLSINNFKPIRNLDFLFIDLILKNKSLPTTDSIILIGIDDKSLNASDSWPWQRSKIAEGVKAIESLGARLVVLDILYAEKDKNPGLQEIRNMINKMKEDPSNVIKKDINDILVSLKMNKTEQKKYSDALLNASIVEAQKILISILSETEKRIDFDRLFVEIISDTKNIIMPIDFTFDEKNSPDISDMPDYLKNNSIPTICKEKSLKEGKNLISPITIFAQKAYALGHIHFNTDTEILRTQDMFICYKNRAFPSLSLQSFIKYKNLSLDGTFDKYTKQSILDYYTGVKNYRIYPNFNIFQNLKYFSFIDVISGQVDSNQIKDKIVIVGLNSQKLSEKIRVSGGNEISTMFIHGVILQNLIDNSFLISSSLIILIETGFLCVLCIFIFFAVFKWNILRIFTFLLIIVWIVFSAYLIFYHNFIVKITEPIILFIIMYVVLLIRKKTHDKEDIQKLAKDIFVTKNLKIVIGAKSDIGRIRAKNEDSYCIDKSLGILAVADGVGGNIAGEIASKMAIDKMRSYIKDNYNNCNSDFSLLMKNAILFANMNICNFASSNNELKGMATTLTAGFIDGNRLIIGHVGDSRAYLYRKDTLEQLTEDHTVAVEKNIRNFSAGDFEKMRHILTRAIGIGESLNVDTFELTLVKGDILLFCSDGLYSMVRENDIISNIKAYNDPELVCGALVNLANKNGGKDNITVITAYIKN